MTGEPKTNEATDIFKRAATESDIIEEAEQYTTTPRQLPIVKVGNKEFFKDNRLKEYRNINNPHERYTFEEMEKVEEFIGTEADRFTEVIGYVSTWYKMKRYNGQSINGEDITFYITDEGELISVTRNHSPDEEALEEIRANYGSDETPCAL